MRGWIRGLLDLINTTFGRRGLALGIAVSLLSTMYPVASLASQTAAHDLADPLLESSFETVNEAESRQLLTEIDLIEALDKSSEEFATLNAKTQEEARSRLSDVSL